MTLSSQIKRHCRSICSHLGREETRTSSKSMFSRPLGSTPRTNKEKVSFETRLFSLIEKSQNLLRRPQLNFSFLLNESLTDLQRKQMQHDALAAIKWRVPMYLLSMISFSAFITMVGSVTHFNDDYFPYYPLPFALEIGVGPSMIPTIYADGRDLFVRDCWSHRCIWLNWAHIVKVSNAVLASWMKVESDATTNGNNASAIRRENRRAFNEGEIATQLYQREEKQCEILNQPSSKLSLKRPWQRGDVVTVFNPHTKSLQGKRIVGLEGDVVKVFGEYALQFYTFDKNSNFGVPDDERFPDTFCEKIASSAEPSEKILTTIIVPPNMVWLEGDNPLCSSDSRHFGPLPLSALRGRIVARIWPLRHSPNELDGYQYSEATTLSKRPEPLMDPKQLLIEGKFGLKKLAEADVNDYQMPKEQNGKKH